jgi:YbgC/YbaW family acyl-CoA thioester hydrolase
VGESGNVVEITTRVRFPETDRYDTAHHSHYFTWFEMGRVEYLRACGLTISDFDAAGIFIVLRECSAKLLAPIRYDDEIVIRTRLAELTPLTIRFAYEGEDYVFARATRSVAIVAKGDGRLLATGATLNVPVQGASVGELALPGTAATTSGKLVKLPAELLEAIGRMS